MDLNSLKSPSEVSEVFPALFPTKHAVEHLIRQHRLELIQTGTLQVINTRKFINIEKLGPFLEKLSAQKLGRVA